MTYSVEKDHNEEGLSFQEKSLIVSLASSIVVYGLFALVVYRRYQTGTFDTADVLIFWGRAILILAVVMIAFQIIAQILFNIFNVIVTREEEYPSFEDERDKLIELKSIRNQSIVFGVGFLLAMAALAFGRSLTVMFVVLITFMIGGDLFSTVSKLVYYRRGF